MFRALITVISALLAGWLHGQPPTGQDTATAGRPQSLDELLLFFPTKYPKGNWQPADVDFRDVYFTAEDRTKLHGWYCACENPRAVILIAHGNAGHVASRAQWLGYLQRQARCSVFMFDYRGYGRSEGVPTADGALQDARAAHAKLCELAAVKETELVLMGESLGGAIVVQLAQATSPRALILQSTFPSLKEVAQIHFARLAWLVPNNKLDSATAIAGYKGPLLQSHGTADRTIPFRLGERLFRSANEPKQFVSIEGADHNDWLTDAYLKQLDAFLAKLPSSPK